MHVTLVTAASSGTHTRAMGWQAARPCAYTGAPDNGLWIPERGLGDTDGVSVTVPVAFCFRRPISRVAGCRSFVVSKDGELCVSESCVSVTCVGVTPVWVAPAPGWPVSSNRL